MAAFWSALMGYLIGCINPSYLIAKYNGFDIRDRGSGNAGASNAVITMGKKVGAFSAVFDIVKAYASVKLAAILFPAFALAAEVAGVFCILGHIFPVSMHFHGGKGLACLGGVILGFSAPLFIVLLSVEILLALIVDYICIVPITASIIFPMIYFIFTHNVGGTLLLSVASAVILFKHLENINRIRKGTEAHLSFLWKRDEEIRRVQENKVDHHES